MPALRTARQRLARLVPGGATTWQWYYCSLEGAFSHLVLLDGSSLLARWVLPADQPAARLLPGMWTQVPPAIDLAVPAAHQAVAHGTCQVVRQAAGLVPSAVPAGQLLLHLPAADSAERYVLTQLQPGGTGWLLRKLSGSSQPDTK